MREQLIKSSDIQDESNHSELEEQTSVMDRLRDIGLGSRSALLGLTALGLINCADPSSEGTSSSTSSYESSGSSSGSGSGSSGDAGGEFIPAYPFPTRTGHSVTDDPDGHAARGVYNRNWDLDCKFGDGVGSMVSGIVTKIVDGLPNGAEYGYGNAVCVTTEENGGMEVCHNHLEAYTLPSVLDYGLEIEAGERIGNCGNSGYVISEGGDGTHLDAYAIMNSTGNPYEFVDPEFWTPYASMNEPSVCIENTYHQCDVEGEYGDVYWFDSCGEMGDVKDACSTSEICTNTSSGTARCEEVDEGEDCDENDSYECYANDIYWYDSCGNRGEKKEDCDDGCDEGNDECNEEESDYEEHDYKRCYGDDVYWYDSNDNRTDLYDDCDDTAEGCDSSSDTCEPCTIESDPGISSSTPSFTVDSSCVCDESESNHDDYCNTLYVAEVTSISGNTADIDFEKVTGGGPSVNVSYWVVVGAEDNPECLDLPAYTERTSGTWSSSDSVLSVSGIDVWPTNSEFEAAADGDEKKIFIITGGADDTNTSRDEETSRVWYQEQSITFTKDCPN